MSNLPGRLGSWSRVSVKGPDSRTGRVGEYDYSNTPGRLGSWSRVLVITDRVHLTKAAPPMVVVLGQRHRFIPTRLGA